MDKYHLHIKTCIILYAYNDLKCLLRFFIPEVYLISGYLWKEKNSKKFTLYAFTAAQGRVSEKIGKC